jgi:hypothetical protein
MAKFKNLTNQIQVVVHDNAIKFYDKVDINDNIILGVKADGGDIVLFAVNNGIEQGEIARFLYSVVTLPVSTDLEDLVEVVNGYIRGISLQVISKAEDYTVSNTDETVEGDTSLNNITLTLPASFNKIYRFPKTAAAYQLTITCDGSDVFGNGQASMIINNIGDTLAIQGNSSADGWNFI